VIAYVADPRNRPLFFPSLKSISDVQGEPLPWARLKWTFVALGMQFSGRGRCLKHEPGKLYSFQTDGGIQSTFAYRAEPESGGTKLTVPRISSARSAKPSCQLAIARPENARGRSPPCARESSAHPESLSVRQIALSICMISSRRGSEPASVRNEVLSCPPARFIVTRSAYGAWPAYCRRGDFHWQSSLRMGG
jgi:hypothetical protein